VGESYFERVLECSQLRELGNLLGGRAKVVVLSGLCGSARALAVAAIQKRTGRRLLWITKSNREAERLAPDVEFFYSAINGVECPSRHVLSIPASEHDPYDGTSPHAGILEQRAFGLYLAATQRAPEILIASLRAAIERTLPPRALAQMGLQLRLGDELPLERAVDLLLAGGYVRQEPVGAVGEFSLRGGILDVFSPAHPNPYRIEFFGDAVDSIRQFDVETQRSCGKLPEALIVPMRELPIMRESFIAWAEAARLRFDDQKFRFDLSKRLELAERGEPFPGWEYLIPLMRPLEASLFDYLEGGLLILDEPAELEKWAADFYSRMAERAREAYESGALALPPEMLFLNPEELQSRLDSFDRIELRLLGNGGALESLENKPSRSLFSISEQAPEVCLISQSPRSYRGHLSQLVEDLKQARLEQSFLFIMPSHGLGQRLREALAELGSVELIPSAHLLARSGHFKRGIVIGRLSGGFSFAGLAISILVEENIFGQAAPALPRRAAKSAAFLSDLGDLKVGDYVVHVDHGIGQFQGLVQMPVRSNSGQLNLAGGIERGAHMREFMLLVYAEGARLYVPVERLDLVQRYSGSEGRKPQLDRLGGAGWQRTKARVKRALRDMAEELLRLYAERKLARGHAYGPDTPWQREFEDAFEYELTPDQERAIQEVKSDMEKPEPMDRLIVGDVGYGKTEVAMRAAFKAAMDGKQVAVLAPTTILAYQHFKNFQQRFKAFPIRIEMLSRFLTSSKQKEVIGAIASGAVDIVIGTHRLLSRDVAFKDLGLLIIDEEQRFGVAHKERLKQMRKKVDVIAMSATPIPRTLNMSLAGIRDMSIIETPPRDRFAIQTHVVQFSEPIIRSAIELELGRGGQVFFVHNRVETIYSIAELIGRLVPAARIGVSHGQMGESELERVMLRFINHELDVLVTTTIIENGIDIPLANTIIINRADTYGLAQLYQLRGRVGRSNRRAYAYLLMSPEGELSEHAARRLAAMREFSELGSGFRIAALDLELRGAGNLLGREQSGHMDAIGFDLYVRLLERTVRELKGEPIESEPSASINLGIDVRIPEDYVSDMSQRLRIYKRISSAQTEEELSDIRAEMEDRYGAIPGPIENLFEYARLRRQAARLGIISIDREGDALVVKFSESPPIDPAKVIALASEGKAKLSPSGVLRIKLRASNAALAETKRLLEILIQ
jgi:transcription-repair coupling factor (superfamily II helicase)